MTPAALARPRALVEADACEQATDDPGQAGTEQGEDGDGNEQCEDGGEEVGEG